ncbi:MAG: T9SS type A sorting domain-containing protein [Chitinophagaceae bacterium]|nr:T9SS type A sorting domain-containing protein [Chitinophagaceae bacterium]
MKKFFTIYITIFCFSFSISTAQVIAPEIEWQNTIGGNSSDFLSSVIQTSDGGYLLGGYSYSGISGDKAEINQGSELSLSPDYWIVKLSNTGDILWQNTIGGSGDDQLTGIIQTNDGGFLIGGSSSSPVSGDKTEANIGGLWADYWVLKLDNYGNIIWQNTIGGSNTDVLNSLIQTSDGGFLLGGYSYSGISGDKTQASKGADDYWIVKLDDSGNIVWQNTIGGSVEDYLYSVVQTTDGGFLLGGLSYSDISGDKTEANQGNSDYWIVKINESGAIIWQNTLGGSSYDGLASLIRVTNGGYLLGGSSSSGISGDKAENKMGGYDFWVILIDESGDILWQNTIGGGFDDYLSSIIQTIDGGYLLVGYSKSVISGDKTENGSGLEDYWVVKLDKSGNILWQNTIGGNSFDKLRSIVQSNSGGYLLAGDSGSSISGDKSESCQGNNDYWVVKLSADVCTDFTVFADSDDDTFGDAAYTITATNCTVPSGYVENSLDCNDANEAIHPGATEIINGIDDDCNGIVDDVVCTLPDGLQSIDITSNSAKLKWAPAAAATQYSLRYKVASGATWTILKPQGKSKIVEGLLPNTKYVWQIKSVCGNDPKITSDWSAKQFFTTLPLKITNENAAATSLEIYPNPSSGNTTLHFNFTQSSQVSIKIFDVNGKEISNVLNSTYEAGDHSIQINTASFTKGIYLVRMISEDGIQKQKLILQ